MKSSYKCALVGLLLLEQAVPANASEIVVQKQLSNGVRLHAVDGKDGRFSNAFTLTPGTHVFEFRYAYDSDHEQNGIWVSKFVFECVIDHLGTYTLRSQDSRVAKRTPTIWIESSGNRLPSCKQIAA